uniref:CTLH domain-containing protein n=1 Tax=Vitis vinifera TaxID=29760 RepID=F6H3W7_VITVI
MFYSFSKIGCFEFHFFFHSILERQSGIFFNLNYVEELVMNGEWEEAEMYLSGFTKLEDNKFSTKIFFEIRKQKYLETLDRKHKSLGKYGDTLSARASILREIKKAIGANPVFVGKMELPAIDTAALRSLANEDA